MTRIVLERNLKGKEKSLLDSAFPTGQLALVFDPQTYNALGKRIVDSLPTLRCKEILLEESPKPTEALVNEIRTRAGTCEAYIAIGSGTINDLCKRAAFVDEKAYAVFATAPSMNGYVSSNASLYPHTGNGTSSKKSYSAKAPVWLFGDLEVLAHAPVRLIRSGLGDSICRTTAQADWLLSYLMLGTPYDARPFELLAPHEERLFKDAARLCSGDVQAISALMHTLIASGEGMTLAGGSYPASQGEHMIAHAYELLANDHAYDFYHGELIAVTTLFMSEVQETFLRSSHLSVRPTAFNDEMMHKFFGNEFHYFRTVYENKSRIIESQCTVLQSRWTHALPEIQRIVRPRNQLVDALEAAGVDTTAKGIGLQMDAYEQAQALARFTRDRFTFLDIENPTL